MISRNFIKSSFIYTVAGALPMASAVVLLPFYITYLPTETYGALSICIAFSYLVQVIVTFSFDSSLYIHYHELKHDSEKVGTFISSCFVFMGGWALFVAAALTGFGQALFSLFLQKSQISFYPYGTASIAIGIFQAVFKVHGNLLQTRERPAIFLLSNVISFVIIAGATIWGLKAFPNTLVGPLGSRMLAGVITSLWIFYRVFREFGIHFQSPWKQTSFSFNAYTFSYQMLQWGINYLDGFIVLMFMPLSSVGIYDFAKKCLVPIELMLNGLNAAIFPKVIKLVSSQEIKQATPEVNRYFYGLVSMIMLVVCVSIFLLPEAVDLFVRESGYSKAMKYIPYVAVIYILKAMRVYFVVPFNILKKMKRLTVLNLFTSVLKIGLMIWMIREWELYGVIASTLIVFLVEIKLLHQFLKRDYLMRFNYFKLIVGPGLLLVMILIVEPVVGRSFPLAVHFIYCCLCTALLWFAYKNEIRALTFTKFLK